MTTTELKDRLAQNDPYETVLCLGDEFVTTTLKNSEAFWSGNDIRRELYAILVVFHHANSNGFESVIDNNEDLWIPIVVYAGKVIGELDAPVFESAIVHLEKLIAANLNPSPGMKLPRNPAQLRALQENSATQDLEWMEQLGEEWNQCSEVFLGCAHGEFLKKIVAWMDANAEKISPLLG